LTPDRKNVIVEFRDNYEKRENNMENNMHPTSTASTDGKCPFEPEKVDYALLLEQRNFLLKYIWKDGKIPEEVEGVINLIETIYDEGVPVSDK
jgi:hypothetical protein